MNCRIINIFYLGVYHSIFLKIYYFDFKVLFHSRGSLDVVSLWKIKMLSINNHVNEN